jgi:hypothetical protein
MPQSSKKMRFVWGSIDDVVFVIVHPDGTVVKKRKPVEDRDGG